jgi:hypothetical protein
MAASDPLVQFFALVFALSAAGLEPGSGTFQPFS